MKRMRILLDMDSVVAETLEYWLDRIAEKTGVRATIDQIIKWEMHKCPPLDTLDPKHIFSRLQDPGFILNIPPMVNAPRVIEQLMKDGHEVYIVTARHGPISMPETLEWVKKHLPFFRENQLIFCYDKHLVSGDFLIDDKPDTLVKYGEVYPWTFLGTVDYPYNRHLDRNQVERFLRSETTWDEIYDWISFLAHSYAGELKCSKPGCEECK